jgi:hypothetical protein
MSKSGMLVGAAASGAVATTRVTRGEAGVWVSCMRELRELGGASG